jgi:hypothetical protein
MSRNDGSKGLERPVIKHEVSRTLVLQSFLPGWDKFPANHLSDPSDEEVSDHSVVSTQNKYTYQTG